MGVGDSTGVVSVIVVAAGAEVVSGSVDGVEVSVIVGSGYDVSLRVFTADCLGAGAFRDVATEA